MTNAGAIVMLGSLAWVGLVGCGSSAGKCVPPESRACVCPGAIPGAQVCSASGTFSNQCVTAAGSCTLLTPGADGGASPIVGTVDFGISFRPQQSVRATDCTTAQVATVKFMFFDQSLDNLLRTEVSRPCVVGERYRVSIDLGPYLVRVQGLNGAQTVCYESSIQLRIEGGRTEVLNLEAQQHPAGMAGGCVYPTIM